MPYNRYQGTSSPWTSGVPPPGAPPTAMYGHPHHNAPHSHHGPPSYGVAAYGSPANPPWGGRHPIGGHQSGGWVQSSPGHGMGNNQRGGMRNSMGGPTGKRASGHWNDGPPMKRMNKGGPNRGPGGGAWRGGGQGGNRRDGRKFENRSFAKDNRRNRDGKGKQSDQNEKKQQQELSHKAVDALTSKEYPLTPLDDGTTISDEDKTKLEQFDSNQRRYIFGIYGFCCKLCNVFLRDKNARLEHYQQEEHTEKFNAAEEIRIKEEKEEAERKAKEEQEKAAAAAAAAKDEEKASTEKEETNKTENGENINGDIQSTAELTADENKLEEHTDGQTDETAVADVDTKEQQNVTMETNDVQSIVTENKEDDVGENVAQTVQPTEEKPPSETVAPAVVETQEATPVVDESMTSDTSMKASPAFNVASSPRGGRGSPKGGRGQGRGGRGGRGRGRGGGARGRR